MTHDEMLIEWQCTKLINRIGLLIDDGRFDEVAELFIPEGVFVRPSAPDDRVCGRAAIAAHFHARPPRFTRHFAANIVVNVDSALQARAKSYLLVYISHEDGLAVRKADPSQLLATFTDRFVLHNGQWLFAEHLGALTLRT